MIPPSEATISFQQTRDSHQISKSSNPSLSSLSKSKGFLIENPDGTLIQRIIY